MMASYTVNQLLIFPSMWWCKQRSPAMMTIKCKSLNHLTTLEHDFRCIVRNRIFHINQLVERRQLHPSHYNYVVFFVLHKLLFDLNKCSWPKLQTRKFNLSVVRLSGLPALALLKSSQFERFFLLWGWKHDTTIKDFQLKIFKTAVGTIFASTYCNGSYYRKLNIAGSA